MDELLPEGWLNHDRESWVWIRDRFVPYPFQNNIRRLPDAERWECLQGIIRLYKAGPSPRPSNFGEWIDRTFGEGLAKVFLRPYNFKVWAYEPEEMQYGWVGERVAIVDLERVVRNILEEKDDVSWGPNNRFRFPRHGGTGAIWQTMANRMPQEKFRLTTRVAKIDTARQIVTTHTGEEIQYEHLISTMPLDSMVAISDLAPELGSHAKGLLHSSTHVIGIGLEGEPPADIRTKCWMYFPEENCPFYRVTVFSNYSPNNTPRPGETWSLMAEVSESARKPVDQARVVEETVQGMVNTRLIADPTKIISKWYRRLEHGYPTPSLGRDAALDALLPPLQKRKVWSRGRFGAWKYEVSNQDHSLMQGVEVIDHILMGTPELTLCFPNQANGPRPYGLKF
jgi:protoporphyrinogen oxidase